MHKLTEYPQLIADVAFQLADMDTRIRQLKIIMEGYEAIADGIAAADPTLKNEGQRKSFKHQYLQDQVEYQGASAQVEFLGRDRASLSTTLERLRNEFAVCKLEYRMQIATTLAGIEDKELVDSSL